MSHAPKVAQALSQPFTLQNGQTIKNRVVKSAMSEGLAGRDNRVPTTMPTLYRRWSGGGVGLAMTGNVMIDRRALGEPGNVVLEDERDMDALRDWAKAGQVNGSKIYMQINHPGRQAPRFLNRETVSPSAVPMSNPAFDVPRALTGSEIEDLVVRFGTAASIAEKAGFDGVQIHGAHGYLVSQFLSPITNKREDKWGGSEENRRRFAIEVYREMRRQTSEGFGVAIKINSADFQKGGISEAHSTETILALADEGLDFVEISGGSYESPAMVGAKKSTRVREAYFLEFGARIRKQMKTPLIVTGGWRSGVAMADAIEEGTIDFVGLARGLAMDPDYPNALTTEGDVRMDIPARRTGIAAVDRVGMLEVTWYERQLHRMAAGKEPKPDESAMWSLLAHSMNEGFKVFRRRRA